MEVHVDPRGGVRLAVYGPLGDAIKSPDDAPFFRAHLPSSGDYVLVIQAGDQPTFYMMSVVIPERIAFEPGGTSAVVDGQATARGRIHYMLWAEAEQVLEVSVTPSEKLRLIFYGVDGTVLMSGMGGEAFYRGTIPITQDYVLVVEAGDEGTSYTIDVRIPARISFAAGTTSAAVEGELPAQGRHHYLVNAREGQLLDVIVSAQPKARLIVYGFDGTVLMSGMGDGASFRGTVPVSQDYFVVVAAGPEDVTYGMQVTIPERINFAPGTTSIEEEGSLGPYERHTNIVRGLKGQTLQVKVSAPDDGVNLVIYGVDGTVLKSPMGGDPTFEGELPSSQDYILSLRSGAEETTYTLKVAIQ
jgi:hypothetical protein